MSKNVAVFVDVANIFYAAKAAGIDIDYVTLLKSATAGRDFVRAYAYTGLDPDNENQRQFHNFLARNGYKVISKDIRKYGDGRIKANLDIELVVDLMKTARNLDIAVVVSGDGDFAPAIRAVQEQGVRVEVISFRGNTSSDLIDVADQFTDIAQIARVEKASGRSGRRVAAEGDLSMTEVPEKETEGAPRRRRGGRTRELVEETPLAAGAGRGGGNVIVLPGERLSRAPDSDEPADEAIYAQAEELAPGELAVAQAGDGREPDLDEGRRRRRRRGGRGRGRGRRGEGEAYADAEGVGVAGSPADEEEDFEEPVAAQPPHHTFGSVWDSQIGVPSAPTSAPAGGELDEEEDLDEPEVPEYLLAERRQRGQRPSGRGGRVPRGRSAYQAALDRERFGRGAPQPSFGGGRPERDRGPERGRDRGRPGRPQQHARPDRQPRPQDRAMASDQPRSAEPWSEVPPELEELLRAELARKGAGAGPGPSGPAVEATPPEPIQEQPAEEQPTKPIRRGRTRAAAAPAAATAETGAIEAGATEETLASDAAPAPKRRTTRARAARTAADAGDTAAGTSPPEGVAEGSRETPEAPAKKPVTRRRTTKTAATTTRSPED